MTPMPMPPRKIRRIHISAVLSLVTIVSIYREGGILKRLRATPLRPLTILAAHVIVKLMFTAVTVTLMTFLGKRYLPVDIPIPWVTFTLAALYATLYRMEARRWITGRWVEKAGQRRRRFYSLTADGKSALARQRETWKSFVEAIGLITGVEHA